MNAVLPGRFTALIETLTAWIANRPVEPALAAELRAAFPPEGAFFDELAGVIRTGLEAGWLGTRGEPPLRYGRAIKPSPATCGFSIDVVAMSDVVGPHHVHPNGEIDMVIPIDPGARFDGHGIGWVVYGPQSAHAPAVTGGTAAVLYALPGGEIRF
jgi:hypothetical protein